MIAALSKFCWNVDPEPFSVAVSPAYFVGSKPVEVPDDEVVAEGDFEELEPELEQAAPARATSASDAPIMRWRTLLRDVRAVRVISGFPLPSWRFATHSGSGWHCRWAQYVGKVNSLGWCG